MGDWKFQLRTLKNGQEVSSIAEPSNNTASAVYYDAPMIDGFVQQACVIARLNPKITVE